MKTILVTGNDTGIGKTWAVGALARRLVEAGQSTQIVKLVETGVCDGETGDAERSAAIAGNGVATVTLRRYRAPIAPVEAALAEGVALCIEDLVAELAELSGGFDFRVVEGAGGIMAPLQADGGDIVDFARLAAVDAIAIVVEDRLGAINQARLCWSRVSGIGIPTGIWLNERAENDLLVAKSTRVTLKRLGIPVWTETSMGSVDADIDIGLWIR